MTGLDLFFVFIVLAVVVIETIRGFGMAVLDLVGLYTSLLLTALVAPMVARSLPGFGNTNAGTADCSIAVFLFVAAIFLLISKFSHDTLLWHIGMFDRFGGFVAGVAVGIVICHGIVAGLAVGNAQQASAISGHLSQQMLTFSDYHDFIVHVSGFTAPRADNPPS
jgi:uncharacterized membrane protein required for colicin V production